MLKRRCELMRKFKKVAVLKGGPSAEREVSLRSGAAVARGLRDAGYDVVEIDVTHRKLNIPDGVDAVFIALHGEYGEDGEVQSELDRLQLPYTGSGALASKSAFDKEISKRLFMQHGVPTPEYEVLHNGQRPSLELPVVIKPTCQGSTIGVHRITQPVQWDAAMEDTLKYGEKVLVERFIEGKELTVGIVGEKVLPVIEIVAPDGWYDYKAKYTKGVTQYLIPAPLDEHTTARCVSVAKSAFDALGCRGFGRVDIRLANDGSPFVLEVNTIPGFTETSLLPMSASTCSITFPKLCEIILSMARFG